jgi:hypothetical protein
VDNRADIYALGVVFYQMLTGELPGKKIEAPSKKVQIDVRLDEIVLRAMEKKPELRYQQASVLKTEIETVANQTGGASPLPAAPAMAPGSSPDKPTKSINAMKAKIKIVAGIVIPTVALIACLVAAWFYFSKPAVKGPRLPGLAAQWSGNGHGKDAAGGPNAKIPKGITYARANVGMGFCFKNNSTNRIIVPNAPELNFGAGQDFSIEVWIKPMPKQANFDDIMPIVDKRETPDMTRCLGYELCLWGGMPELHLSDSINGNGVSWGPTSGHDLRDGKFHQVAVTVIRDAHDGGKMYVDGRVILTFDPTDVPGDLSNDQPLHIGNHSDPAYRNFFRGVIGDVSIYKRALTTDEIQTLYKGGGGVLPASATETATADNTLPRPPALATPHPTGLMAFWSGENNGLDSVGQNDAELTDINFAEGQIGRAFSFNGTSSTIRIPASPALDLGAGSGFTLMAWIKPKDINGLHPILAWSDYGGLQLWIGVQPMQNGVLQGAIPEKGLNHQLCSHPGVLTNGVFQHIAFTYDKASGTDTLYLNGVVVAQRQLDRQLVARTHGDLWVSRPDERPGNWSTGRMFSGLMNNIELYNRALSAEEIQSVCKAENHGEPLAEPAPSTGWFESWMR